MYQYCADNKSLGLFGIDFVPFETKCSRDKDNISYKTLYDFARILQVVQTHTHMSLSKSSNESLLLL